MRRAVILLLATIFCGLTVSYAQTQQQHVVVKTRGRIYANSDYKPGVRIPAAVVRVRSIGQYESDSRGEIKFGVSSEGYTIEEIKKTGYTLSDADILFREQKYTPAPLYILLENSADLVAYRREIERQVRRNYQATLDAKQAEIERLRSEGKATAEELERLQAEIDRSWDLAEQYVDEMTEHYLLIDFDNKEKFDQEVSTYILAGELEKADSLIATRGDLEEDIRKVKVAEQALENAKDDAARRCYYKYEIASQRHERDSAAYWLEQRAMLDKTNVYWLSEATSYILDFLGDYDRALNILEPMLEYYIEYYGEMHDNTATIYSNIGVVYDDKGLYDNALEYLFNAKEIQEKILDPLHPSLATTYSNIGLVYDNKGLCDQALKYYNKALYIKEKVLDSHHPSLAATYNNIGGAYYGKGSYDEAMAYYAKAIEIFEVVFDPLHPSLALIYCNTGAAYDDKGMYDQALECYNKAREIQEKVLYSLHPDLAITYVNIGATYDNQGLYDEALTYYVKALDIFEKVLNPMHPSLASLYSNMGLVYKGKGFLDDALEYYNKALNIREKVLDPQHPDLAITYVNIAGLHYGRREFDICLEYLDKALVIFEKSNHPYTTLVQSRIEETKTQMEKQ